MYETISTILIYLIFYYKWVIIAAIVACKCLDAFYLWFLSYTKWWIVLIPFVGTIWINYEWTNIGVVRTVLYGMSMLACAIVLTPVTLLAYLASRCVIRYMYANNVIDCDHPLLFALLPCFKQFTEIREVTTV